MLDFIWDTKGYFFWLLVVSAACVVLERLFAWRRGQPVLREQLPQDVFWLVFNGHYAGILVASAGAALFAWLLPALEPLEAARWIAAWPFVAQVVGFLVLKDFLDWSVHNMLHRVSWLWTFHKVHHSIEQMDWIGNFRFHWMEVVVYRALTYLPLLLLGVGNDVVLWGRDPLDRHRPPEPRKPGLGLWPPSLRVELSPHAHLAPRS